MGTSNQFRKRKAKISRSLARRDGKRAHYARILIVCEGKKTEPSYFRGLKNELELNSANVEITGDSDSSPKNVVAYADERYQHEKNIGNPFDRVYCVIDKDQHPGYTDALKQIKDMDKNLELRDVFHAITSVPCFEYFLLLHFKCIIKRFANCRKAKSALKCYLPAYRKNDANMFAAFRDRLDTAKINAAKSLAAAEKHKTENPSTRARELVEFMQNIRHTH